MEESRRSGGLSTAGFVSILVHALLIAWFVRAYTPSRTAQRDVPIARYVELIKQNPREFVESPGRAVEKAPLSAPLSDANRRASTPQPTGDRPTLTPGDGSGIYTPPMGSRGARQQPQVQPSPGQRAEAPGSADLPQATDTSRLTFNQPASQAPAGSGVDWRHAIREVGKVASLGGAGDIDLGQIGGTGGEQGFAEQGPLSFETQWYDWGEYAQSMVSKIRIQWYANMPQIIRTGMKGVATIRFTIQRDGRLTDITLIESSGVPPYDFAARKAIESASPLNPLPKDFPNPSERVTAMFFYNMEPQRR
ncbi:MAG: energy transducer TonB [Thermoanaerobaculia bacterium]